MVIRLLASFVLAPSLIMMQPVDARMVPSLQPPCINKPSRPRVSVPPIGSNLKVKGEMLLVYGGPIR